MGRAVTRAVDVAGLDWRHTSQNDPGKGATEPAIDEQALGTQLHVKTAATPWHTLARAGLSAVEEKATAHRRAKELRLKGVLDLYKSSSDSRDSSSSSSDS